MLTNISAFTAYGQADAPISHDLHSSPPILDVAPGPHEEQTGQGSSLHPQEIPAGLQTLISPLLTISSSDTLFYVVSPMLQGDKEVGKQLRATANCS